MHQWGPHSADNSNSEKPTQHACDALCSSGRGVGLPILVPGAMLKCDECITFFQSMQFSALLAVFYTYSHYYRFSAPFCTIY